MRVNVANFEEFVKKTTLNYSVNGVKLVVTEDSIKSGVRGENCITVLNVDNDMITNVPDEIDLHFLEPNQQLKMYLDLIDNDECDLIVKDEKIILKDGRQKSTIHFCSPNLINSFEGEGPNDVGEIFHEGVLNDDIMEELNKIKKVAPKFQKVYFIVEGRKLYIETADRTNRFSNGVKIEICECSYDDVELCFDFKNFNNLLTVINGDYADFNMKLTWVEEQEAGMVSLVKSDGSEKYFLVSRIEDTV